MSIYKCHKMKLLVVLGLIMTLTIQQQNYANPANCKIKFFDGTLSEAIDQAHTKNQYLFLHTTSETCSPCQTISSTLCADAKLASFYNEYFISYKLDLDTREDYTFSKVHNLGNTPALFYMNTSGQIIKKGSYASNADELIGLGVDALELNTRKEEEFNFQDMKDKYNHNYDSPDFLYDYAYMLKAHGEPHNKVVNQYLATQKVETVVSERNRAFIYDFTNNIENEAVDFFLGDINHYKEVIGGRQINDKIKIAIYNSIVTAVRDRDAGLFNKALNVIEEAHLHHSEAFEYYIKALYYEGVKDWDNYAKATIDYFDTFNISEPNLLHDAADKFFLYQNGKKRLQQALEWIDLAVEIEEGYQNNLTRARILRKLGRCEEAKASALRAIEIAKLRELPDALEGERLKDSIESRGCKEPSPGPAPAP